MFRKQANSKQINPFFETPFILNNTPKALESFPPIVNNFEGNPEKSNFNNLKYSKGLNSIPVSSHLQSDNANPKRFGGLLQNLELNLKGLKLYNKYLNLYSGKWNSKKIVLDIKKNPLNSSQTFGNVESLSLAPLKGYELTNGNDAKALNGKALEYNLLPVPVNLYGKEALNIRTSQYLKSITKFNTLISKSQHTNIGYNFNINNNKLIKNIISILNYSFISMSSLISKPVFSISPDKVVIHLFFFLFTSTPKAKDNSSFSSIAKGKTNQIYTSKPFDPFVPYKNILSNKNSSNTPTTPKTLGFLEQNRSKLNILCTLLSRIFQKPIELDLVRLYYPHYDSQILVNAFGIFINKIKLRFILKNLFKYAVVKNPSKKISKSRRNKTSIISSFLSGIKIKIAGRLMTQRVVPRQTVKTIQRGSLARGKVLFADTARFTNKNKRGAFSVTITTGHIL